ncbi:TonB-dependent siderophore receptor [Rhizobium sp. SAFR-030]|uniref:TonB-dependent siderophore receptor n=1 Tax=Rhizobium sp. SAFR-030 TaxID=3387277 RepID=UPI003F814212
MQTKTMGARKSGMAAGIAVAALVAGSPALAQDAIQLDPVLIQGQKGQAGGTGPVQGYVPRQTTAGAKTGADLKDIPQSVSVVGREELDDRGVTNKIDEALRYTAGVSAEPFGTDADTDWVYIRGFDATQTGVFYDGLNLYGYGFGGFQLDPFMLERVEVLKGPASVLYGGANAGGIVNLVRKRPTDEPLTYTEAGINTNGNAFFGFDLSDAVGSSETMTYRLTGKIAGGDNYSDFSNDFRGFIMPQLTIAPDEATKVTLWGSFSGLDQLHGGGGFFPYVGTVVDAPGFGRIARDAFYGEPGIDTGVSNQEMVGYEVEHEFDSGWKVSQNARYAHLYKYENAPYLYGWYSPTLGSVSSPATSDFQLNRLGFDQTSKVNTFLIDNRLEGEVDTGPLQHALLFGLDYKYYELSNYQASTSATPISASNPIYGAAQSANNSYSNQTITQKQIGLYAQDQLRFGDGWLVTLNGRYDHVETSTRNGPTFWSPTQDFTYDYSKSAWTGRAGLAYEFDNGLTPYVSVASFFNPVIAVSATPDNKPEEGVQYEAGLKYEPTFVDGLFTASLFHLTKKNVVVTDPGTFLSSQIGEVESRGVELEAKVNLNDDWKLLGSFTYTDLEVKEDIVPAYVGKSPYIVPDVQAALWLDYSVPVPALEGLSIGAGVRYQGESWANRENTLKVPDATVFDAAIRYKKDGWEGSINVANVFDKEYVRGCGGATTCGYGEARTVLFKLSKSW